MRERCQYNKTCSLSPMPGSKYCFIHQGMAGAVKREEPKFKSQVELFNYIWKHSDKKSQISGCELKDFKGTKLWLNCFAHVLDKKNYPKYRLLEDNVWLTHPKEHQFLDQGTEEQRKAYEKQYNCSFNEFYKKREELKIKYKEK